MIRKINKSISILLILMLLIGITPSISVSADANTGTIILVCPDRDDLPEGAKVRFGIEVSDVDGIASYKLLSATDGGNYAVESEYGSDAAYVIADVKATARYYIVKAYDETGTELASSDAVVFGGKREAIRQSIWNLDFEDESLSVISSGLNKYLSADGVNAIKSNGDTIGMHTGDDDNTITIESTDMIDSGKNGKSLVFSRNGNSGVCQINNGWAKVSSGVVAYSVDVATDSYGDRTMLSGAAIKAEGGNQWFPLVDMRSDGNVAAYLRSQSSAFKAPGTEDAIYDTLNYVVIGKYEPYEWHNIKYIMNIENGTLDIYFDNEYVATDYDRISSTMTPARFTLSNGTSDGALYADNIKAYTIEHITVNPGLSIECKGKDYSLPEGAKVKIDIASTDMDDVARIDLMKSVDGNEYTVEESFSQANVSTCVELTAFSNFYMAVAYDSQGDIIKESEAIKINADSVVQGDLLWDIDFETQKFTSSAENRYLADNTGTALAISHSGATSTLSAHTGGEANDITIEDSGDELHGRAIKLTANDEKQVQFNEFRARTTGGTVIGEWDVKFESFPQNTSKLFLSVMDVNAAPDGTGANEKSCGSILMKYSGGVPYFIYNDGNDDRNISEITLGKWYNIKSYTNLDIGTITLLIDGEVVCCKSFDTADIWMEKYVMRMSYAEGCEVWVDNFKVQRASVISVPEIVSVTNDENSLYVEFAAKTDADLFCDDDGKICNIVVKYEDNILDFSKCEETDNPNILRFTSVKKVYTSVPLDITITIPYNDDESVNCTALYTAPPAPLDVTDINASYNGNRYNIEATLCNTTGKVQTAVMVAVFYDESGNIVAVRPSALIDNVVTGSKADLSGSVTADKMHIFFIDNWTSSKAIKNVVYKR